MVILPPVGSATGAPLDGAVVKWNWALWSKAGKDGFIVSVHTVTADSMADSY